MGAWNWFTGTDPDLESEQVNYDALKVRYFAQLKAKVDDGRISDYYYQSELSKYQQLQGYSGAYWDGFLRDVETAAAAIPKNVQSAAVSATEWAAETVGKTGAAAGGGFLKGWLGSNWIFTVGLIVGVVILVVIWKPVIKPILDKMIIIPV